MPPRPYHHGDLRNALIALATDEIALGGVEALSLRELARKAQVAHRAAYQHFPDKSALLAAAFAAGYDRLAARLDAARDRSASPQDQLKSIAAAYGEFALEEPNLFLAMSGPRINDAGVHAELETAIGRAWRHVVGPIAAGVDSGAFTLKDKMAAAAIFWCGLNGIFTQAALGRLKLAPDARRPFIDVAAARLIAALSA